MSQWKMNQKRAFFELQILISVVADVSNIIEEKSDRAIVISTELDWFEIAGCPFTLLQVQLLCKFPFALCDVITYLLLGTTDYNKRRSV